MIKKPDIGDFETIKLLGIGSCGQVYLVKQHDTNCQYAMKVINNDKKRLTSRALNEQEILIHTCHPFIATSYYCFKTDCELCIIMGYCEFGNFYNFMQKQEKHCFNEEQTKYYASCILLALEYLHFIGVIYRDLKPENILVCSSGRIRLSDFDLSLYEKDKVIMKKFKKPHSHDWGVVSEPDVTMIGLVGTAEYLAPEILEKKRYTCVIDWWSFGIFIYEMLFDHTPFRHRDNEIMYQLIKQCHLVFPHKTPKGLEISSKAKHLIKNLLKHDPNKRIGFNGGATEIKCDPFFRDVAFQLLFNQDPPIIPHTDPIESPVIHGETPRDPLTPHGPLTPSI